MTNVGTVMIEQPRMARFHTASPGCADSPCTPGSASRPWASVAAWESPTTSTFTGLGSATGAGAAPAPAPPGGGDGRGTRDHGRPAGLRHLADLATQHRT